MKEKKSGLLCPNFFEVKKIKFGGQKISEAIQRVRSWCKKEFSQQESLPQEFKNLNIQADCERARDIWQKHF